jgi:hypothetical protein
MPVEVPILVRSTPMPTKTVSKSLKGTPKRTDAPGVSSW